MSEFSINIKKHPVDPTQFNRGDSLEYSKESGASSEYYPMLVVGEDDTHLHTFMSNGEYYGIYKRSKNLQELRVVASNAKRGDDE